VSKATLRDWLPSVLQHVEPWVSSEDIEKGACWILALGKELETSNVGIICLVPGNDAEPWLNFEAGVISRAIDTARVAPFLVGIARGDVKGPLAQFQSTVFEKEDMRRLVHSINRASDRAVPNDRLDRTFEAVWPRLLTEIERLDIQPVEPARPQDAPAAAPASGGVIFDRERDIVRMLAEHPDSYPDAEQLAHALCEKVTRTQNHLDRLRAKEFVNYRLIIGQPATYYLTAKGRQLAVETDLI
jgi:hypothetical protein